MTTTGYALPIIKIDSGKCDPTPFECRMCVTHCEPVVFVVSPNGMEKFKETPYSGYELRVINRPACTGCMKCVQVCPQNAIEITFPGR